VALKAEKASMLAFKNAVKSVFRAVGFDVRRPAPFQLLKSLNRFDVDLVFDVGANVGQFASELRSFGFEGEIVSFEPLSAAHRALSDTAGRDKKWQVHPRCVIGDRNGEIEIHLAGNSVSSSVLPMLERHSSAFPSSAYVGAERVPICTFDSVAPHYLQKSQNPFLKIDTQGFEWQVLDGALQTLPRIMGIHCELSLVALYKTQHLWMDMVQRLKKSGFTLWSIERGFTDARDGRTLQVDATFFRS
jgi:FkbM family methyltransferase